MKFANALAPFLTALLFGASEVRAETYGWVDLPAGEASFADNVISYLPGSGLSGDLSCQVAALALNFDAHESGCHGTLSVGTGGSLVVEFTDNALVASGDASPDLAVFEVGSPVETYALSISLDSYQWLDLGIITGGTKQIDIDPFAGTGNGNQFRFVKVTDTNQSLGATGPYAGIDIEAIGAISSSSRLAAVSPIPLPAAGYGLLVALAALIGLRRRQPQG